jgi:hypothetical protein
MNTPESKPIAPTKLANAIVISGLVVGTADILCAFVQTLIAGRSIISMLQFIASGVFGRTCISGTVDFYAAAGLLFHYIIATSWTALFFVLYPVVSRYIKSNVLIGILYGAFVWLMMNKVVLPLSQTPTLKPTLTSALIGMSIIITAIGLPLAFFANRLYSRPQS